VETFFRAPENGNANADSDTRFARLVQDALLAGMRPFHPDVRDRGVKPDTQTKNGAIGVLNDKHLGRRPGAPRAVAALAELEFITNPKVDRLIVSGPEAVANRARVAGELAKALRLYLKQATLVA
jgi:N-acetylmuramoyl-L-alanine amidase